MHEQPLLFAILEKLVGVSRLKVLTPVDLAGGQTVTEHLRYIFFRHLHADDALAADTVIGPIFKMVAVAALVVHPGGAVPFVPTLGVVGAAVPLKIFDTGPELHRGELGQIVGQALPVKPQTEAVLPHQSPMALDRFQMPPEIHTLHLMNRIGLL